MTEWELLNDAKALWLRSPGEVEEEEYTKFYKALSKVGCIRVGALTESSYRHINLQGAEQGGDSDFDSTR